MTNRTAAVTLALATAFGAGAADAQGYGHGYGHGHRHHNRGPEIQIYIQPPQYYAPPPPPVYYVPPPVRYYAPPPIQYAPRIERYCTDTPYGSVRQSVDTYTGQVIGTRNSRTPCPY